jgi:hypothetical protein
MKKLFSLLVAAAIVSTSCTKDILNPNIPGNGTETIHHGGGTEDNHNGGGNDDNNNGGGNDDNNNNNGGDDNVSSVPDAVLSVFNARYTDAANIEWKLLSNGNYKAEFFRGSVKWQTTFTPSGTIVKEEHD